MYTFALLSVGSVEATGLRRATEPQRPSSPSEAHSSKKDLVTLLAGRMPSCIVP